MPFFFPSSSWVCALWPVCKILSTLRLPVIHTLTFFPFFFVQPLSLLTTLHSSFFQTIGRPPPPPPPFSSRVHTDVWSWAWCLLRALSFLWGLSSSVLPPAFSPPPVTCSGPDGPSLSGGLDLAVPASSSSLLFPLLLHLREVALGRIGADGDLEIRGDGDPPLSWGVDRLWQRQGWGPRDRSLLVSGEPIFPFASFYCLPPPSFSFSSPFHLDDAMLASRPGDFKQASRPGASEDFLGEAQVLFLPPLLLLTWKCVLGYASCSSVCGRTRLFHVVPPFGPESPALAS